MTIDEILSHLSDEDANVVQRAISSLCGMITITEYETKRIPGCIQDIAPNKKWSNIL
jgi:hypothetical protein